MGIFAAHIGTGIGKAVGGRIGKTIGRMMGAKKFGKKLGKSVGYIAGGIGSQYVPILGSYKKGGRVKRTGAYILHKGEKVIPVKMKRR